MFKQKLAQLLEKETKLNKKEILSLIEIPPEDKFGDYSFPCFKLGPNPKQQAEKLKKTITLPKFISKIEVKGPYLNFFIHYPALAKELLPQIYKKKENFAKKKDKNKNIVIDFSAPNIAKPFGIQHLRSTVIGNALYKILNFQGYNCIGVNHLGDWGTQFGKVIVAYKKWGDEKQLEKNALTYLLDLYVKFHQKAEKKTELEDEAREWFKKLEKGNKEALALWENFRELSLEELKKTYDLMGIEFDSYHGEAFYNDKIKPLIKKLKEKDLTEMSEGALVVPLKDMPPLLLKKSDGATTYATRDLAAAIYRIKEYKPEKILYVVAVMQKLHFKQFFTVLEKLGCKKERFKHISFGTMKLKDKKLSTRKGNIVLLEDVLQGTIDLVKEIIEDKNPQLKNKGQVAKEVGIGAVVFWDLVHERKKNITFDLKQVTDFEGETGPYIQYTHARACSILKKADQGSSSKVEWENYNQKEEIKVVKILNKFKETINQTSKQYRPHLLAHYLLELSQAFNEFYHKCPVITDKKDIMKARLLLVDSTRQILETGLDLLGIKAPKEM